MPCTIQRRCWPPCSPSASATLTGSSPQSLKLLSDHGDRRLVDVRERGTWPRGGDAGLLCLEHRLVDHPLLVAEACR